jgi:hypothetical protein
MREYFKILSSIAIALLFLTMVFSGISALVVDERRVLQALSFPFVVAWIGFLIFGIIGSALWLLMFKMFWGKASGGMRGHLFSAITSALISVTGLAIISLSLGSGWESFTKTYAFLVMVFPVVFVSLYVYKCLYSKTKT